MECENFNFIENLKPFIINESDIQKVISNKEEGIEFSLSGELVPFEVVQGEFLKFLKELESKRITDNNHYISFPMEIWNGVFEIEKTKNPVYLNSSSKQTGGHK